MRFVLLLAAAAGVLISSIPAADPVSTNTPAPATPPSLATFGGGCFWCVEAQFKLVPGVVSVVSGYAGGSKPEPTYEDVCSGKSGHAEVIQVAFDPARVSYDRLLELFWAAHDPTTLNRQGNDKGTQYRSIILYHTPEQKDAAETSKAAAQKDFSDPIVTEIVPLVKFYPAEDYHQDYARNNPGNPYCQLVVRPKVDKFQKHLKP